MIREFWRIMCWESLQNIAPVLGLVGAVRLYIHHRKWALVIIVASALLGATAIQVTEPLIYRQAPDLSITIGLLVNTIAFACLALLGTLYLSHTPSKPTSDIGVGVSLACLLALIQALVDGSTWITFAVHASAMSASFGLLLLGLRWALAARRWRAVLVRTLAITGGGSAIIIVIDYGYLLI